MEPQNIQNINIKLENSFSNNNKLKDNQEIDENIWKWVEKLPDFNDNGCPYHQTNSWFESFLHALNINFIFEKFFVIIFACVTFGLVARRVQQFNDVYSFLGITLLLVTLYIEVLIIRDHIWILEAALPEAQRIKNVLFTTHSISKTRWRKILVMIFTSFIFTLVYFKTERPEIIAFLGTVLFITILYYEILQIRDDIKSLLDTTLIFKSKDENK